MQTKPSRENRVLALILTFVMVFTSMSSSIAMALSGTVTNATNFTFTYVGVTSSNYHFTLESEDEKTWYGTCMDPEDQSIPYEGMSVSMSKVADDAMIARIAYEGTLRTDLSIGERRYIISRAAAYHLGRIDAYSMIDDVDRLLKDAKNRTSIPESFVVYKTAEADYGQQILAWRNIKPTTVKIKKTTETVTEYSKAGAKYGLYTTKTSANNGSTDTAYRKGVMTTDAEGASNVIQLYFTGEKTYYVKEFKAPAHLGLDEAVYSKKLKEGDSWTIHSVEPLLEGGVRIKKVTTVDPVPEGYSLAGAVYGVYASVSDADHDTNRLKTLTTKESGMSNTASIEQGTYYVKEVSCPDWLLKDETVHTVVVTADNPSVVESTDPVKPGYVTLKKSVNGTQDYSIAGAEYGIYISEADAGSNTGKIGTLVTDADGTTNRVQVEAGKTYYVKEYKAPANYQVDPTIHPAFVPYGDWITITVSSVDMPDPGWVKIAKSTKTVAPYSKKDYSKAGARYGIFSTSTDAETLNESLALQVLVTDADGNTPKSGDLQPGTYYVRETHAPDNLELDSKTHTVRVKSNETQTVDSVEPVSTGWAKVKKNAADAAFVLTECPEHYSLAGAEYTIYTKSSLTAGSKVGTLVTKENGESDELQLTVGDYWIVETKPSPGFDLDGQPPTKITVKRNHTAVHTSKEPPLLDPVNLVVDKKSGNDKENAPSLAGTVFKVRYYTKITDDVSGLTPKRTWYFKTKEEKQNGTRKGVVRWHDDYLDPVRNKDDLYKDQNGLPTGLIGTYVITEEAAPAGYLRDAAPRYAHVNRDGTVTNPKVSYTGQPTVPNNPKEFRLVLEKQDGETGNRAQGDADLAGAVFGLYRNGKLVSEFTTGTDFRFTTPYYNIGDGSQKYTVKEITPPKGYLPHTTEYRLEELEGDNVSVQYTTVSRQVKNTVIKGKVAITKILNAQPNTGALVPEKDIQFAIYLTSAGNYDDALDSEKQIITTDRNGYAETKMLPYGNYTVHQINTMEGHDKVPDFTIDIDEHNETERYTLNNDVHEADVRVVKVDSETGQIIPVAGATFKLRKSGTEDWIGFLIKYPNRHTVTEFVTDETGTFQLPDRIPAGQYELVETKAPYGYVFSEHPVAFCVDGSEDPVLVEVENTPQKGIVQVIKTGEVLKSITENTDGSYTPVFGESPIKDAVFDIFAKTDIFTPDGTKRYSAGEKVDTVTIDAEGIASSKELYLGAYEVKEVTAGANHVLNENVFDVTLTYDAQKVQVCNTVSVINDRQKAVVSFKKDLETDDLYGYGTEISKDIVFGIYAEEAVVAEDGTIIPKDGLIEEVGIMPDGTSYKGTFSCDLPHGSFYVQETATAEGYHLETVKYPVQFDYTDQSVAEVQIEVNDGNVIENKLIRGDVTGRKVRETGDGLSGACIGLFHMGENKFTEDTALLTDISDEEGRFSFQDVAYGKYIVREINPPTGYMLNNMEYPVEITENNQVIKLEIENQKLPDPVPEPEIPVAVPEPEPAPEVQPEPVPEPEQELMPEPEIEVPEEVPEPLPETEPELVPEVQPEPEAPIVEVTPVPGPKPNPAPQKNTDTPETRDRNHMLGWMAIAIVGIGGLIAGTRRKNS